MNTPWYRSRFTVVFFHILAWVVLFSLPLLFHRDPDQAATELEGGAECPFINF